MQHDKAKAGLFGWLRWPQKKPRTTLEELRQAFTTRYHHFKILLTAHNEVQELMAGIERALAGDRPFGFNYVRAAATRISTAVFQAIKHLDELAPGCTGELVARFKETQRSLNPHLTVRGAWIEGPLLADLAAVSLDAADLVGVELAGLGEAKALGLPVPDGVVVTGAAHQRFMEYEGLQDEINRRIQAADPADPDSLTTLCASLRRLILEAPLPPEIKEALAAARERLAVLAGPGARILARGSAVLRKERATVFAGQLQARDDANPDRLAEAYREILASRYSAGATAFRLAFGIPGHEVSVAVAFLAAPPAACGGLAHSRSPLDPSDDRVTVYAAAGGSSLGVSEALAETLALSVAGRPPAVIDRRVDGRECRADCPLRGAACPEPLPPVPPAPPALSDAAALAVAGLAVRLEEHLSGPQDVEWTLSAAGEPCLLGVRPLVQARPRTACLFSPADGQPPALCGGTAASPGLACGQVFVAREEADIARFPERAVLVVERPEQAWSCLVPHAAAVVAEAGGRAGRLADLARELSVPAVFGLPDALRLLAHGAVVTVDADRGAVFEGGSLPSADAAPGPSRFKDSPVHRRLAAAAEHILPLRLWDPEATNFKPRHCETMHDIARYCHERAVDEMFRFGTEHGFPEAAAKQLVGDVRKQFWVVNLDDGFVGEVTGKFVRIEEVASIPMQALWEGMNVIPWAGPPPVHTRGMLAVLVEASANPALDPMLNSHFAVRNYFMISKRYLSLTSRFGFHFCGAEAVVSERTKENYIAFTFKGGAADLARRVTRARFVAELLELFGFRATVREDAVSARIEGFERGFMEDRLRILGYLIMHTRQLDMVMTDQAKVAEHRARMLTDIRHSFPAAAQACPAPTAPLRA